MFKRFLSIVAAFAIAAAASYAQTSTPYINTITPASVSAGVQPFTMVVTGSGFTQSSVVRWNGLDQVTTFISSTQLSISVPASYVAIPGTDSISVYTPAPSPSLSSISVTPAKASINAGSTQQFQATGKFSDGSTRDLTGQVSWSCATPSVATVTAAGLATAVLGGNAVISASSGPISGSSTVTVISTPPPSIVRSTTSYTLFPSTAVPSVLIRAGTGVESGMKFTSDQGGYIQGVRFYKSAADNGTHVGSLWTSTGKLLAQATFSNETQSGWQQVNFNAPVLIQANTTYVVSYHSTFYGYDGGYFNRAVDNAPLHAVLNSATPNGVYGMANTSVFPNIGGAGANFWVDVAFLPLASNGSLTSITLKPANTSVTAGATQQFQAIGTYSDSSTRDLTGQVSWVSNTTSVATISSAGLATGVSAGSTQITASLNGVSSTTSLTISNSAPPSTNGLSLFSRNAVPRVMNVAAGSPLELGMKFTADRNGFIAGVRYYKGSGDGGPHVASLWSSTGKLLAQATFVNETVTGWQQVNFTTPVAITANTVYVVSYHSATGYYSYDPSYFSGATINNPPLHGLWNAVSTNGVYAYGAGSTFPYAGSAGANFWVDVVFY